MKIIITGPTGFIGQELLTQALSHPRITTVVALTRRDLPTKNPKLRTYIMKDEDFLSYSDPALKQEIAGSRACLWSLGLRPSKAGRDEWTKTVSIEYTAKAAGAFQRAFMEGDADGNADREGKNGADDADKDKFRFLYISGAGVERDQNKSLWFMGDFRRLRGESENVLLRHADANKDRFETYILRPGLVSSTQGTLKDFLIGLVDSVRVDMLAKAMIDLALHGGSQTTFSNQEIGELAGTNI